MILVCKSQKCTCHSVRSCVCTSSTGYQMASCAPLSRGRGPSHPEGRDPGSRLCAPREQAPQLGEHKRQRPLISWRLPRTPGACAALLQPRLERAVIRLACFVHARHMHTQTCSQLSNRSPGLPRTTVLTAKERRSSLNGLVIPA